MNTLYNLRRLYGDHYAIEFPDGLIVPWKLLSVGDYLRFDQLYQSGRYPPAVIEDEIFKLAVVDQWLVHHIDELKAGIIATVSQYVLLYSAPQSPQDIQLVLNVQRHINTNILHQIVGWICTAFTAYKPDDLYLLDYPTLILRLVQAEEKLLRIGLIKEPFNFFTVGQQPDPKPESRPEPVVENTQLKNLFDQQMKAKLPPPPMHTEQTIITKADMVESTMGLLGHEKDEVTLDQKTQEVATYYKDYLDQMARGEKIQIKTSEQRVAEAEVRMIDNKQKIQKSMVSQKKSDAEELVKLKQIREQEKKRKSKRRV